MFSNLNMLSSELDNEPVKATKSKLYFKSIARAAMNIDDSSPLLEVIPIEDLGYVDGEITTDRQPIEVQGQDHSGNVFNVAIETSNTILATWLPLGTNRLTVPHIRRGERVLLLQYGDVDSYYWIPLGWDDHLRKLETVTYAISNTKDENDTKLTVDNTYSWEMSTHKGLITLQTSKSNGEKFKYTLQINAKGSQLIVSDDADNFIEIDSEAKSVLLHNTSGSLLNVIGTNILAKCSGEYNVECNSYNVKASNATVQANTAFKGSLTSNGKNISDSHSHTNVTKGPSTTGSVS